MTNWATNSYETSHRTQRRHDLKPGNWRRAHLVGTPPCSAGPDSGRLEPKDGAAAMSSVTLHQMDAAEPEAFPAQPSGGSSVGPDDAAAFFRQLGEQTSKVLTAAEEAGRGIREQARRDAAGIIAEARVEANELALAAASQRRAAGGGVARG